MKSVSGSHAQHTLFKTLLMTKTLAAVKNYSVFCLREWKTTVLIYVRRELCYS